MKTNAVMESDAFQKCADLHRQISLNLLGTAAEDLFTIESVQVGAPPKARVEPSDLCARCGEPTMRTKLERVDDEKICRRCLKQG